MDIEISVHVSPVDYLLNRVRYLVELFRLFGRGDLRYRFIVTVGADQEPEDLEARCPWATEHPIEFRWAERAIFRDHSWQGVGLDRFRHDYSAPLVLLVDLDLLFAASVGEAIERLPSGRAIAGVMEFRSPFIGESGLSSSERWRALYRSAGLGEPSLRFKYSIDRYPGHEICPAHFGLAFVLARREVVAEIGRIIFDELEIVERDAPSFFSDELALTLAIDRLGLTATELPLRFSHPLSEGLYEFKDDWRRPVVLNYTTNDTFNAKTDIELPDTVAAWLRITEPKAGVREIFRRKLAKVHAAVERSGRPLLSTDPLPPDRVAPDGDDFRVPDPPPRLIGNVGSTNLVEFGGKIFAVPQQLGALDVADERARLASGIIAGASLDEVFEKLGPTAIVEAFLAQNARIAALEAALIKLGCIDRLSAQSSQHQPNFPFQGEIRLPADANAAAPILEEANYWGHNLVRYLGQIYAVPVGLGHINFESDGQKLVGLLRAESLASLRAMVTSQFLGNEIKTEYATEGATEIRTRLKALEELLTERSRRVASLEATMQERDQRLKALEQTLDEKNQRIAGLQALEETLGERTQRIAALEATMQERDRRLKALEQTLEEKNGRIAGLQALEETLGERTQRIAALEATMEERSGRLQAVEKTLEGKDQRIAALEAAVSERSVRS